MTQTRMYGIPNCQTVKKAQDWLKGHDIPYEFINFKIHEPTGQLIQTWLKDNTIEQLLNKRGTTWRKLSPEQQKQSDTTQGAIQLMIENPSLIKRPVLMHQGKTYVGFSEAIYQPIFGL